MASSRKNHVTFATLPREVRDKIYEHLFTKPKAVQEIRRIADFGPLEHVATLKEILHACRTSPGLAEEAFEVYFRTNTFWIAATRAEIFLQRPVCFIEGRGFLLMTMFVKAIETDIDVGFEEDRRNLSDYFRNLLACSAPRHVTVTFGITMGIPVDRHANKLWEMSRFSAINDHRLAELEILLTLAKEPYQELKEKVGVGLTFETRYQRIKESIKAWTEHAREAGTE